MRVAIDHSPIVSTHKLAHKIRGTGFYTKNLIEALQKFHPEHEYVLFTQGEKLKNIDVFHYPYFEPFFVSIPLGKRGKTVVTVHDVTPLVFPKLFPVGIKGKVKFRIQKRLVRQADAIITDSEFSKKDIMRILDIPALKVHVIPLAVSSIYRKVTVSKLEKEVLVKKYNLPEKFALYVGDATPNKNLKRLVEAIEKTSIPLVLVGGALQKQDIDPLHPWNLELSFVQKAAQQNKNIYILGFVQDMDLVKLYNLAAVFVFPSLYEGFGLPVLEAATCGTPIVTAHAGSVPEVIGSAAKYVDPYDTQSIRDGVMEVLEDRNLREKLSKEGLEQSKKFSWEKTVDRTVKVYEEIYKKS